MLAANLAREDLVNLDGQIAELEGRVGPDWPRLKELRRARRETAANLEAAASRVYEEALEAARSEEELARQNEMRLDELFARELRLAAATKTLAKEYDAARREYEQKRASLERLLSSINTRPFKTSAGDLNITTSIGVCFYSGECQQPSVQYLI